MHGHTLISRDILPRQLALQHFDTILKTDVRALAAAVDWISQATITLSLSDCSIELARFAEQRSVEIQKPGEILEAMFSLEGLRASLDWSAANLVTFLKDEAITSEIIASGDDISDKIGTLSKFFEQSKKLERTRRAQRIYDGLLPNFESCSSIIDFRPVFDEERQQIVNGIIAATLTLEMREPRAGADPKRVSFQVDATDIDQLSAELSRLDAKMKALKVLIQPSVALLNPTQSLK